jgi:hypothetical protein
LALKASTLRLRLLLLACNVAIGGACELQNWH